LKFLLTASKIVYEQLVLNIKENFYKKESVFLFIESILLGVGEIFESIGSELVMDRGDYSE